MIKTKLAAFSPLDVISYVLMVIVSIVALSVMNYGEVYEKYSWMLWALVALWVGGLLFCVLNMKKRILGFLFYLTIFLFLIGRILIPELQGTTWWYNYSVEANIFAVRAISYSIISIAGGMTLCEIIFSLFGKETSSHTRKPVIDRDALLFVVRIILIVCMLCFFIREADKLLFMRGRVYEEYFSEYHSRMPFFINFPAGCMQIFLCILLALKPPKKETMVWLFLYVISALPMLKIGVRNNFILNCLFAFVYFYFRNMIREKSEKPWIGKVEKLLIICVIPVMVIFLGAYNYIRDDKAVNLSPSSLVVDFVYKQGTTYDTVLQGYVYEDQLPWRDRQNYTMGAVTDTFFYNSLGKKIFNLEDIGEGNGLKQVFNGHIFSHAISYVVLGKSYVAGEGRGSSYIIENYLDWGYPGIVGFSMFIGLICSMISLTFGKKWFFTMLSLNVVLNIFFTPRAESTAFITFLFSYKFWVCVLGCVIAAKIWEKYGKRLSIPEKIKLRGNL